MCSFLAQKTPGFADNAMQLFASDVENLKLIGHHIHHDSQLPIGVKVQFELLLSCTQYSSLIA